ncbi:MAG TPA: hypothetical protein VGO47_05445 [Chlamydiales bacterium]|nr:hypothetical protein [Chlamydiales bacterium]
MLVPTLPKLVMAGAGIIAQLPPLSPPLTMTRAAMLHLQVIHPKTPLGLVRKTANNSLPVFAQATPTALRDAVDTTLAFVLVPSSLKLVMVAAGIMRPSPMTMPPKSCRIRDMCQ